MLSNLNLRNKLILSFAIIGLFSALTGGVGLYYTSVVGKEGENLGIRLAPLGDAAMEIKLTATTAHLLFEEIMAGDAGEDINEVWTLLGDKEGALFYCDAILEGRSNEEGTFYKSEDPAVIAKVKETRGLVEAFIQSARTRYDTRINTSGTGSAADQQFDDSYESIIAGLDGLNSSYAENAAIIKLIGDAKFTLADAHLFFEEFLAGDPTLTYEGSEGVKASFENGMSIVKNINELTDGAASEIASNIESFITAADQREQNYANNTAAGGEVDQAFDEQFEKFINTSDEAEEIVHESMAAGAQLLEDDEATATGMLILITLLALGSAITLGIVIAKSISKPMESAVEAANSIAKGNFNVHLDSNRQDEIGNLNSALNQMVQQLKSDQDKIKQNVQHMEGMLQNIENVSEAIANGKDSLSDTTAGLAQGATQQASSLEEISSSLREITSQTKTTADNAQQVNNIAQESQKASDVGNTHMNDMVASMQEISDSSNQISKIIKVIDDIAFQTNLLALNAAVEAARAGQHGKGFAVVAEEVRNLASRSAKAAQETSGLIEMSNQNVQKGEQIAAKTADALKNITEKTREVHELIEEISKAAKEQNSALEQVDAGLDGLNAVTQQNTHHSETIMEAVNGLSEKADLLMSMLNQKSNGSGQVSEQEYEAIHAHSAIESSNTLKITS